MYIFPYEPHFPSVFAMDISMIPPHVHGLSNRLRFQYCDQLPPPPRSKGEHNANTVRLTRDPIGWAKLWRDLKKPMLFRHLALVWDDAS